MPAGKLENRSPVETWECQAVQHAQDTSTIKQHRLSFHTPLLNFRHRRTRQKTGAGQVMRLGVAINVLH